MDFESRLATEHSRRAAADAEKAAAAERLERERQRLRESLPEVEAAIAALRAHRTRSEAMLMRTFTDSYVARSEEVVLAWGGPEGNLVLREVGAKDLGVSTRGHRHPKSYRKKHEREWKQRRRDWEQRRRIGWLVSAVHDGRGGVSENQFFVPFESGLTGLLGPGPSTFDKLVECVEWSSYGGPDTPGSNYSADSVIEAFLENVASHLVDLQEA